MPRKKDPADVNELAYRIVQDLTGDDPPAPEPDQAKAEAGRKGGTKGGPGRAAKLTPEERTARAKKAASSRWKDRHGD